MIKILGEEFELDTMDLDVSETIEKEMKKVPEKLNKLSNNVTRIEAIRETVIIVSECMDNILGKGASERIFKGKRNLKLAMKAFEELAIGISKEDENVEKEFQQSINKYSSNRVAKRHPNHQNKKIYNKKYNKK
ncbi:MAG: DUF6673 family protein [Paeniclostridium sordellii]|nr:DUF6673 family protein [Paeniclostridium sordellii]